tara:strand:+ start:237 stop:641 length:405 start_codon:yes stop_codon:yes gene_type:complete
LNLVKSWTKAWKQAFNFKGVTSRKDFWYFILANMIFSICLNIFIGMGSFLREFYWGMAWELPWIFTISSSTIYLIIVMVTTLHYFGSILVNLTATIRRLRDTGKNWIWVLVPLWNLYLCTKETKELVTTNYSDN